MSYKPMIEVIAIEKTNDKANYEIIGPNDAMDLFGFKDPLAISYIYCKLMEDGFQTLGSYQRSANANITSILTINHLN